MKPNPEEIAIGGHITPEICDGGHIEQAEELRSQIENMLEPEGGR